MKKIAAIILLVLGIFALALTLGNSSKTEKDYLRVHIRADSNEPQAQEVKLKVRDEVVSYLTPIVSECETKEEAMKRIGEILPQIEEIADRVLKENGFSYGAAAKLKEEEFPTRVYEGVTLKAGKYDALILLLGSGKGDNWWCVVYPPLCFQGGDGNVVYKSRILAIIKKFFD